MGEDSKNKKIIGPALPPGFDRYAVRKDDCEVIEAKPKRLYGPPVDETAEKPIPIRGRSRSPPPDLSRSSYGSRESWMTETGNKNSVSKIDPLNIKPRTFIQRRTESYENFSNSESIDPEVIVKVAKDKKIDNQIKEYNEIHRKKTLQEIHEEEHMGKKKAQTASDRQERIFDWERDMNSTVRQMSSKSAKDLVNKSTLNDRFGSSSSRKYL